MPRQITIRKLARRSKEAQAIQLPRRARVLHVETTDKIVFLYAELEVDASTIAFDRPTERHFRLIGDGDIVPDGTLVGCDGEVLVYEVRG